MIDIQNFKSGVYRQLYQYQSFTPEMINDTWKVSDTELIHLLSIANIHLGELNAFSQLVPDVDFFIKMHIRKEANTSSRIEGTQTNMEDVLQKSENINPEKKSDWTEVQNYISAMNLAIDRLDSLPLSNRLIKETHKVLLDNARGKQKLPGEFRSSQNWIGGSSLNDAVFIPPHQSDLPELMSDFEKFINDDQNKLPDLLKIGIAHYQFETIHPFLDGNGRIGRLLITLYLVNKGLLRKPCLYLSDFLEKNKTYYYDKLMRVRTHNDLTQWLKFFLEGIRVTAQNSIETFKKIIALKTKIETTKITTLGKKTKTAQRLLNYLYTQPLVDIGDVAKALSINNATANRLVDDFLKLEILIETTGYKRNRVFLFKEYFDLFNL